VSRFLTLLVVLILAGVCVFLLFQQTPPETDPVHRAFARAKAYYLNENNADYRRARMELEAVAARLATSVAYHVDMALIDLQEINHRVQDESRLLAEPDYQRLLRSALDHLTQARALDPGSDAVTYNLARTYLKLAPSAENDDELRSIAERLLRPLTEDLPLDPSTLLLYGDLLWERDDREGAARSYDRIVELGSDYVSETIYFVALNKQAQLLQRIDPEAAAAKRKRIEELFPEKPKPTAAALERGRFTEFLELTEAPPTVSRPAPKSWEQITERTGLPPPAPGCRFIAPDFDGDCARDLVLGTADGLRVFRNRRNASYEDLTKEAGLPGSFVLSAAAAGDVDNDGLCDLVIGGPAGLRIFLNHTDSEEPTRWRFMKAQPPPDGSPHFGAGATQPVTCLALWDLDHDGDLDLFVGGPEQNRVYRLAVELPIDGGKYLRFEDITEQVGMAAPPATDALILDVEDDHDVDLLLAGPQGNAWFENLRHMRFEKRYLPAGAPLGAGDVDNDLREEVRVGRGVYEWGPGLREVGSGWRQPEWRKLFERDALVDLDGDGVLEADPLAGIPLAGEIRRVVASDLNRDGSQDLILQAGERLDVFLAPPSRATAWIDVQPRGLETNEFGIGTRLRLFAGDLRIGATCRDGLVSFGLGHRPVVDAVLVRWTNGVEQGVVTPQVADCARVDEREGEVGSCPFLYAFDGRTWHFIADCHSGTPLGLPYADGKYLPPRSDETVFVSGSKVRAVDGVIRLDLAEEFRELFYVDQVVLRAIDHPANARPVLNEGFKVMKFPEFRVYSLGDLRPPRAAHDHQGRDILPRVRARDGDHAVVWKKLDGQYAGLAYEWSIVLDFGDLSKAERILLVMDGWVEFPTASASIAASRSQTVHFKTPAIEVIGPDGKWQLADRDPGFPAGKGKAVLVDLTGKVPTRDGRLRISGTQRIHWDAFQVSVGPDRPLRLTTLPLLRADHRFRGVGKRVEEPGQPWRYSHDDLETFHRWDQVPAGLLTRYGDVRALVSEIDDRYPTLATGDVVELAFDASGLPPLPEGWVRDYCFTTEGWVKDADMNQAARESVGPLPFHAMSQYPYDEAREQHPHPEFVQEWFTRPSRALVNAETLLPAAGFKGRKEDPR
jgi:tetratricopeptide (TPR) repeat protein